MFVSTKYAFGLDLSDISFEAIALNRRGQIISRIKKEIESGVIENGKILQPDILIHEIKKALALARPKRISIKNVVASLPESQLFIQVLPVGRSTNDKYFEKELAEQAQEYLPIDINEVYADYLVHNIGEPNQEVLFVAAPRDLVDEYVEVLQACGLTLIALDMEAGSLARCLIPQDFEKGSVVIFDIGARTAIISVLSPEGMRFSMNVPVAGNEFSNKIAESLKTTFEQAEHLKKELGLAGGKADKKGVSEIIKRAMQPVVQSFGETLEYYKHEQGEELQTVLLVGGTSMMKGLPKYLKSIFQIDFRVGNTPERPMNTAVGLALRGISANPISGGINLLPKDE